LRDEVAGGAAARAVWIGHALAYPRTLHQDDQGDRQRTGELMRTEQLFGLIRTKRCWIVWI